MFDILKFAGFLIAVLGGFASEDAVTHEFVWQGFYAFIFGCTLAVLAHFGGKYGD